MSTAHWSDDELEQAITWLVHLRSGEASDKTWQECTSWRTASPAHEAAWQALLASEELFELAPPQARIAHLALQDCNRTKLSRRRALKLLGLAGASAGAGWLALGTPTGTTDFATTVGQRSSFSLAEHTHLWLNTDSAADRQVDSQPPRILLQRGQIQVAHHAPTLPALQVRSDELLLETRNARFDLHQQGRLHRLAILDGTVEVRTAHQPMSHLTAGQEWQISASGLHPVSDAALIPGTWVQGQLVVKRIPLAQLVAELARYRNGWLLCSSDIAELPVSGVFQLDDIERTLDALSASLPVKTQRLPRLWTRIVPA